MITHLRPALVLFVLLSILTGVIYPVAITGIAQIAFPAQASGSIISSTSGAPIGSSLIGQEFGTSDAAVT
jgi:K+-transporting ATPase ATPase C chain